MKLNLIARFSYWFPIITAPFLIGWPLHLAHLKLSGMPVPYDYQTLLLPPFVHVCGLVQGAAWWAAVGAMSEAER